MQNLLSLHPNRDCKFSTIRTRYRRHNNNVRCIIEYISITRRTVPVQTKCCPVDRSVMSVPRHVGGVAVEGIPGDQSGIEVGEEGGGASEGAQGEGKEAREVKAALSGRFHDDLSDRTGCVVVKDGFSVSRAE